MLKYLKKYKKNMEHFITDIEIMQVRHLKDIKIKLNKKKDSICFLQGRMGQEKLQYFVK